MKIVVKDIQPKEFVYYGDVVVTVRKNGFYYHASTPNVARTIGDSHYLHAFTSEELGEDAAHAALITAIRRKNGDTTNSK